MSITFNNTDDLINTFAKSMKVSKVKLSDFVEQLKANAVDDAVYHGNERATDKRTSADSLKVRQWMEENGQTLVGRKMTNKEFASIVGVDQLTVCNNINWIAKHKRTIKFVGKGEKPAGQRGRAPLLWEIIAKA